MTETKDQRIAYFSQMFQAIPQLMEVQKHAGGTFVSTRRSTVEAARRLYPQVPVARYRSWFSRLSEGYRVLAAARAIVTGTPGQGVIAQFPARRCMVFHGTYMLLPKATIRKIAHFDLICTMGPRMLDAVNRYRDEFGLKRVVDAGYLPFGSFPEKDGFPRETALAGLGLSPDRRTVVYMPWGRPYGSWNYMAETLVRETPPEFNLILRPHPSHGVTSRNKDRLSFLRIGALCRQRGNTLLDRNVIPLAQLYALADLMVTDGTSPAEESLFYDVPQLFIETPLWNKDVIRAYAMNAEAEDGDLQRYLGLFDCGPRYAAGQARPWASVVDAALASAAAQQSARADYFAWVFGQRDRSAGERVHGALEELLSA